MTCSKAAISTYVKLNHRDIGIFAWVFFNPDFSYSAYILYDIIFNFSLKDTPTVHLDSFFHCNKNIHSTIYLTSALFIYDKLL